MNLIQKKSLTIQINLFFLLKFESLSKADGGSMTIKIKILLLEFVSSRSSLPRKDAG